MRKLIGGALAFISVSVTAPAVSAAPSNAPSSVTFPNAICVTPPGDVLITDFVVNGQGRSGAHTDVGIVHPLLLEVYQVLDNGILVLLPEESFVKNNFDNLSPTVGWICAGQVTLDTPDGPFTLAFLARATISPEPLRH